MNVYDFDKTIYPGDSALHFWLFCLRRHPAVLRSLPRAGWTALRRLGAGDGKTGTKQAFFAYLRALPDTEEEVRLFWDRHIGRIYPWYLAQKREDDVIISASPAFLVEEACRRLGVTCIASRVDPRSGAFDGANCWGEEKPRRFAAAYGNAKIDGFYSDSLSDEPMMALADRAFVTKHGKAQPWTGKKRERSAV